MRGHLDAPSLRQLSQGHSCRRQYGHQDVSPNESNLSEQQMGQSVYPNASNIWPNKVDLNETSIWAERSIRMEAAAGPYMPTQMAAASGDGGARFRRLV